MKECLLYFVRLGRLFCLWGGAESCSESQVEGLEINPLLPSRSTTSGVLPQNSAFLK